MCHLLANCSPTIEVDEVWGENVLIPIAVMGEGHGLGKGIGIR